MNGNVEALRRLFVELGGDPSDADDCLTTVAVLNAIARQLGGEGGAIINPAAIDNIADVAGSIVGHTRELSALIEGTIETLEIPDGTRDIRNDMFSELYSLKSVVIPSSVRSIGLRAFMQCGFLKSVVISEGVTSIGIRAFESCMSLESVVIPSSVRSIGSSAFDTCVDLKSVVISEGVTSIAIGAFAYCAALESVVIPSSVRSIGSTAFSGVSGTIYCRFSEGAVDGAPWGATGTIVYDYNG